MNIDLVMTRKDTGSTLKAGINAGADKAFRYLEFER
jgi:hypothetical protein